MEIPAWQTDEAVHRQFMARVESQLYAAGIHWKSIVYHSEFYGHPLVVTLPGIISEAAISVVSAKNRRVVDSRHFPEEGVPQYCLSINEGQGHSFETLVSADPEEIVAALVTWAASQITTMRKPLPKLKEDELIPLRCLAEARSSVSLRSGKALANGADRVQWWQALGLAYDGDFASMRSGLTDAAREQLDMDILHIAADQILLNFPRVADGRLLLKSEVLLASYEYLLPQNQTRQMWLTACGPDRRRDGQVVRLALCSLIGVNHPHRWDQARWLWDDRYASVSEEVRWGVSELSCDLLGLDRQAEHLAFVTEQCNHSNTSLADRVAQCILLQDAGRIEEAFALFGVELTPFVLKVLYGRPLFIHSYIQAEDWETVLLDALRSAAPWRFPAVFDAGKRQRFFAFPHQGQQRKASLVLSTTNLRQCKPCLEIEFTASNKRLPEVLWKRPVEIDLLRFKL